jgi:predicted naringenin-chalcone synthase
MTPRITRVVSAAPDLVVKQDEVFDILFNGLYRDIPRAAEVFGAAQVRQRHFAWHPRDVAGTELPSMGARMRAWEGHVLALARQTCHQVLDGVHRELVGSFILASCTGYSAPGPDSALVSELGLRQDIRRSFIGHMGCSAAFNAIKVALDALAARPAELALITCAEVCSVHASSEVSAEQMVIHSLFADACCSVLLSAAPRVRGEPGARGPEVVRIHSETHPAFGETLTWRISDSGFRMTVSPYLPAILAQAINPFVTRLLSPAGLSRADVTHWGVHPGGPKIIDLVGERLDLTSDQLRPSREILAEYGNCSSPTILLILERVLATSSPQPGEYGVFMAFGPGLAMESMLVRF